MKFIRDRCRVLVLGIPNPGVQLGLASTWQEGSPVERDLGVLVDHKLGMSEQCAKRSNRVMVYIKKGVTSREKSLSHSVQCLSDHTWSTAERLESIQRRTTRMVRKLESLSYDIWWFWGLGSLKATELHRHEERL